MGFARRASSYASANFSATYGVRPVILAVATISVLLLAPLRTVIIADMAAQRPIQPYTSTSSKSSSAAAKAASGSGAKAASTTSKSTIQPPTSISNAAGTVAAASTVASGAACVPNTGYRPPAGIALADAAPGVSEVVDPPQYYQVYGATVTQIGQELNQCAPHFSGTVAGANYLAYTSYQLSWQFGYGVTASGECALNAIKVGQHVSQIFPAWSDSGGLASAAVTARWQAFSAALQAHEAGHVALNTQYANKLLVDLQALVTADCSMIASSANTLIQADVAALNQAHLDHDVSTSYGASTGAIF